MKVIRGLNLANPAHIYTLVWLITLILFMMGLTSNIQDVYIETLLLVFANILSFYLCIIVLTKGSLVKKIPPNKNEIDVSNLESFTKKLLWAWGLGTLVDIYFSGGLPFVWALMGDTSRNYTNFGIPSFHGIVNACYLLGVTCLFLNYLLTKDRRKLLLFSVLLFWPILMLGRGILLSALMQCVALYFLLYRVSLKAILIFLIFGLTLIILFGVTGDLRGYVNPFASLVNDDAEWIFNNLPSGFLWVYIYVTTGINNINANITMISPSYMPWYSVSNLVPSAIKILISDDKRNDALVFVDEGLNTSSFYAGYLSDFGALGAFLFVVMLQFIWAWFYVSATQQKKVSSILAYAIILQCVIFSIFYDLFLLLPYIFQIMLTQLYGKSIKWKKKPNQAKS